MLSASNFSKLRKYQHQIRLERVRKPNFPAAFTCMDLPELCRSSTIVFKHHLTSLLVFVDRPDLGVVNPVVRPANQHHIAHSVSKTFISRAVTVSGALPFHACAHVHRETNLKKKTSFRCCQSRCSAQTLQIVRKQAPSSSETRLRAWKRTWSENRRIKVRQLAAASKRRKVPLPMRPARNNAAFRLR